MAYLHNSTNKNTPSGLSLLLIEDDDEDAYEIVNTLLQDPRVKNVRRAVDGFEAMEWLKSTKAFTDLILCDINMPRMDGLDFLTRIQADMNIAPPVVMLSSSKRPEDFRRSHLRHAATYVHKPSSHEALEQVINVLLCSFQLRLKMPPLLAA